jgi:replicative DNA helicase
MHDKWSSGSGNTSGSRASSAPEINSMPKNLELERLVLGALLTGDHQEIAADLLVQSLEQSDFSIEKHKRILERMKDLQKRGEPIDRVTLAHELHKQGQLASVDGISYLMSLEDGMPTLVGVDHKIHMLRELARLRAILERLDDIRAQAMAQEDSASLLGRMARIGEEVSDTLDGDGPVSTAELLKNISVDDLLTQRHAPGIEPFIPWLAEHMRFTPKSLTIVAARPSVGKSAFAQQQAWEAINRNYRTYFYTLEVSQEDNVRRVVSQQALVNMRRLKTGCADVDDRMAAQNKLGELALDDRLRWYDRGKLTVADIVRHLWRAKLRGQLPQLLIVDFMQLMTPVGKFSNEVQAMTSISRGLKLIAQEFSIAVLGLSQMNREVEKQNRKPKLSDLRESGSLEQDASNVIFLHRLGDNNPNDHLQRVLLMLAKNKEGEIGERELIFTKRYARFDEVNR